MNDVATVRQYMTTRIVAFAPEMDLREAIRLLRKHRISGAPVVDAHGALVGILSKRDCLKVAFRASYHQEHAGPVAAYMSPTVETVEADARLVELAERFVHGSFRRFPVLDHGRLVGIISRDDVLRALDERW
jgi:CBS domain-containing protein